MRSRSGDGYRRLKSALERSPLFQAHVNAGVVLPPWDHENPVYDAEGALFPPTRLLFLGFDCAFAFLREVNERVEGAESVLGTARQIFGEFWDFLAADRIKVALDIALAGLGTRSPRVYLQDSIWIREISFEEGVRREHDLHADQDEQVLLSARYEISKYLEARDEEKRFQRGDLILSRS
jgi:hypothetical protein